MDSVKPSRFRRFSRSLSRHPSTAPRPLSFLEKTPALQRVAAWISENSNFYRLHLLFFIFTPLIFSAIFYASNGEHHISYVDSLFMVVSSVTVTGLNSILLADCTVWQQVILFLMMTVGSTSSVSIITIIIRRRFFRRKFEYMVAHDANARRRVNKIDATETGLHQFSTQVFETDSIPTPPPEQKKKKKKKLKISAAMVRRVDVPVKINQMSTTGWLKDEKEAEEKRGLGGGEGHANVEGTQEDVDEFRRMEETGQLGEAAVPRASEDEGHVEAGTSAAGPASQSRGSFLPDRVLVEEPLTATPKGSYDEKAPSAAQQGKPSTIQIDESSKPNRGLNPKRSMDSAYDAHENDRRFADLAQIDENTGLQPPGSPVTGYFPRSRTVEFRDGEQNDLRLRRHRTIGNPDVPQRRPSRGSHEPFDRSFTRTTTMDGDARLRGFGGFPNPLVIAADFAKRRIPALNNVERAMTMPRTTTITSVHTNTAREDAKAPVSYISFDAVVGRNSKFHGLTTAQQEELGGVEFRALTVLLRIVVGYYLLSQLLAVLILAPWLTASNTYKSTFSEYGLTPTWFSFFQVWSAFSNNGMSLVDASMVPFQKAYLLIVVMSLLILGGNTAFPVFLRLIIWTISKIVPRKSRVRETLQFLLDHPRRCFIYLFPSHQTWFLVFVLVVLNAIDWVCFLVLDIGNSEVDAIPVGVRVIDGLMQAFAVRAAGFSIVTLSDVAPALQLLYIVMMYVAVYPIAVSIRSTNVYEEKSMGVFEDEDDESEFEARFEKEKERSPASYISYHARKQLAFDMWWLVLAVWLICIIERHNILSNEAPWITIFTINKSSSDLLRFPRADFHLRPPLFEVCSSYGTVGLSLGTPLKNTSLAGALRPLSRLVLCAVMIRGRHRGLPMSIDRAVLLPGDLERHNDDVVSQNNSEGGAEARLRRRTSRESSRGGGGLSSMPPLTDAERVEQQQQTADAPIEESTSSKEEVDMNQEGWK